jgi:polyribonucleotide nucleotidyltransferase
LLDGGVPLKEMVAGIAMGMMSNEKGDYKILTDIQGPEDHFGDMDFKVAGTESGVTAVQMDVKVAGVPLNVLSEAFAQARVARLQILEVMKKEISEPRDSISKYAPEIISLTIKEDQIGLVIGKGGETINELKEKSGVQEITIEDDGTIFIVGKDGSGTRAKEMIEELTHEYVVGEKFTDAKVVKIMDFGAFVEIANGVDGLVHISEIAPFRIQNVSAVLKEGEVVSVVIKEIEENHGKKKIGLSIKDVDPKFAENKGVKASASVISKKH